MWILGVSCLGIGVAGCTPNGLAAGAGAPNATVPPLLQPFVDFPVHTSPRPIVVLPGPVGFDMQAGGQPASFPDDDSKLAYVSGAIDPPSHFPDGPAQADGYPIIGSAEAFRLLTRRGTGSSQAPAVPRLWVTAVSLGKATFETDRGSLSLPAWLFSISKSNFLTPVLALAPARQWTPSGVSRNLWTSIDEGATIGKDDRNITIGFIGARSGTGPCTSDYSLAAAEYPTFVAVRIIEHRHGTAKELCTLEGYRRSASTVLQTPIGNRLLVNATNGRVMAAHPG